MESFYSSVCLLQFLKRLRRRKTAVSDDSSVSSFYVDNKTNLEIENVLSEIDVIEIDEYYMLEREADTNSDNDEIEIDENNILRKTSDILTRRTSKIVNYWMRTTKAKDGDIGSDPEQHTNLADMARIIIEEKKEKKSKLFDENMKKTIEEKKEIMTRKMMDEKKEVSKKISTHFSSLKKSIIETYDKDSGEYDFSPISEEPTNQSQDENSDKSSSLIINEVEIHESDIVTTNYTKEELAVVYGRGEDDDDCQTDDYATFTELSSSYNTLKYARGAIDTSFYYLSESGKLIITIYHGKSIPLGKSSAKIQVSIKLEPSISHKYYSKMKIGINPRFNEVYEFKMESTEINTKRLRFRIYLHKKFGKTLLGSKTLSLLGLELDFEYSARIEFGKADHDSDNEDEEYEEITKIGAGRSLSNIHPEILIGLLYNDLWGQLTLNVLRANNLRSSKSNNPDTYVEASLISGNLNCVCKKKTLIAEKNCNPIFDDSLAFEILPFEIKNVSLVISLYRGREKHSKMIGSTTLGFFKTIGKLEQSHWNRMLTCPRTEVRHWYIFEEDDNLAKSSLLTQQY